MMIGSVANVGGESLEKRGKLALGARGMIGEHLESDHFFGHALLELVVDERVVDAEAAKDAKRLEQLLVGLVEWLIVEAVGNVGTSDDGSVAVAYGHAQDAFRLETPHRVHERVEARV